MTTTTRARTGRTTAFAALAIGATLALAGCTADAEPRLEGAPADTGIRITDAWVKAADSGMTGAFGVIENTGGADVTLVAASTDAATMTELHETVMGGGAMQMQEKEGGFVIPAGEQLVLEPGSDHLMLMDLTGPILPGDAIDIILEFADGAEVTLTATAKDFTGANEEYVGGHGGDR